MIIAFSEEAGYFFEAKKIPYNDHIIGVNPEGFGVPTPDFELGGRGGRRRSWTGHEILLYLIMYRKYVRKWSLFKRSTIICPEFSYGQFCLDKRSFWSK